MVRAKASVKVPGQVYEEASDWLVLHRTGPLDHDKRKAFDAWLRASPDRIQAYLEVSAIWEDITCLDPQASTPSEELIARASAREPIAYLSDWSEPLGGDNEQPGVRSAIPAAKARIGLQARLAVRLAALISALCVICFGVATWWLRAHTYSTAIGEQRTIALSDGSTVRLNARSVIRVDFLRHRREVTLFHGQALFAVAEDPARPFLVHTGGTQIQVVGTQFDVNDADFGTLITVVRGRVAVFGQQMSRLRGASAQPKIPLRGEDSADLLAGLPAHGKPIFLTADEQVTVTAGRVEKTQHVNAADVTAWTQRQFVFADVPLAEVVDEFNRYSTRQLVVTNPKIAGLRINAVFSSTDPSLLVSFLRAQPDITLIETNSEIRISQK